MLNPIPEAAMPVVEILRRDVKRPTELPRRYSPFEPGNTRWNIDWKHQKLSTNCCPMGLHPKSLSAAPSWSVDFANGELGVPRYSEDDAGLSRQEWSCDGDTAVHHFAKWWDLIDEVDVPTALYMIWPRTPREVIDDIVEQAADEQAADELGYEAAQYDMFRFRATELEARVKKLEEIVGRLCQCVD